MRDVLMRELVSTRLTLLAASRIPDVAVRVRASSSDCFRGAQGEVWLHTVYLKNLSDTVRFPHWVIDEPVELLQALLTYWASFGKEDKDQINNAEANELLGADKRPHLRSSKSCTGGLQ